MRRTATEGSMFSRRSVIAGAALALGAMSRAGAQIVKINPPSEGAVRPEDIDKRVERDAADFKQRMPQGAERHITFDFVFPHDPDEYRAVGKSALFLVVAVSQNAEELPLRRVYTRAGGRDVEIPLLGRPRRLQTSAGSIARGVFGAYRSDAFYLAPVGPLMTENVVLCDFARNRTGFAIYRGEPFHVPDFIRDDPDRNAAEKPDTRAVKAFLDREYPGFGVLD
jgi:hypothetical protein